MTFSRAKDSLVNMLTDISGKHGCVILISGHLPSAPIETAIDDMIVPDNSKFALCERSRHLVDKLLFETGKESIVNSP